MDLKDVLAKVKVGQEEAELAFHAGHHEVSENFLMQAMVLLCKYFDEKTKQEGDVTESATSEKPADETKEKPAPASPAAAAGALGAQAAASQTKPPGLQGEKPPQ